METIYGMPALSIEERQKLPESVKEIRENKMTIIDKCGLMANAVSQIKFRARGIPLEDDAQLSAQVAEWKHKVLEAESLIWEVAEYGIK